MNGRAAPPPAPKLSEQAGLRIAMLVVAAPVVCCLAGLVTLGLLRHRVGTLAARYAALHAVPFPGPAGVDGDASSFLHVALARQDILFRNPAQWRMDVAMAAFALTPALVIAGGVLAYGLVTRRKGLAFPALAPMAALAWLFYGPLHMMVAGRALVLDAAEDRLALNGHTLARLSNVAFFVGRTTHRPKGGADFSLTAVLREGPDVALEGPDARADIPDAAAPMNAILQRLRGGGPDAAVDPACGAAGCVTLPPAAQRELNRRIGEALGAKP